MTDTPKAPATKPELTAFEKMKEFTRRLVAVPKSELAHPKPKQKGRRK